MLARTFSVYYGTILNNILHFLKYTEICSIDSSINILLFIIIHNMLPIPNKRMFASMVTSLVLNIS